MSEYCSLYINIEINEEKLSQFFQETPSSCAVDANWVEWWNSRGMYSPQPLEHILVYRTANNRTVFDELLSNKNLGCTETYDTATQTWTFIVLLYSENYFEIMPMLALLKQLAGYQEAEEKGVAFIYDFCWGDDTVMAYIDFSNQKALFKNYTSTVQIMPMQLNQANQALEELMEKLSK